MKFFAVLSFVFLLSGCAGLKSRANDALDCPVVQEASAGAVDLACEAGCAEQKQIHQDVCVEVCNFLANFGKSVLEDKLK